jgi:hypothetical protein
MRLAPTIFRNESLRGVLAVAGGVLLTAALAWGAYLFYKHIIVSWPEPSDNPKLAHFANVS